MGIVNAVDICKYPQHFNRLLLIAMNKYVLFLRFFVKFGGTSSIVNK